VIDLVTALNSALDTDHKTFYLQGPDQFNNTRSQFYWQVWTRDVDGGSLWVGDLESEQLEYILNSLLEV